MKAKKGNSPDASLNALPRARMRFIEPMLARLVSHLPAGDDWSYELKLDGYRAVVMRTARTTTIFSRRGNKLNDKFSQLANAFDFLPAGTIIDGEIVALDDRGRPSFAALQTSLSKRATLYFYAFDLLAYQGRETLNLPLSDRRALLENDALRKMKEPVRLSAVLQAAPGTIINAVRQAGLEGVVAKRLNSRYESGERTDAWLKYKTNQRQELVIGGYKPGQNSFESLLVGYYEDRKLMFVAKIKNGFVPALRREVAKAFKGLETDECPFANLPEPKSARRGEALTADVMKKMRWLKPKLVAQIEFTEWTKGNHLRHSKFVGLRHDKNPKEVTREHGG